MLIHVVLVLVVAGVLLWLIESFVPMDAKILRLLQARLDGTPKAGTGWGAPGDHQSPCLFASRAVLGCGGGVWVRGVRA
jgi:hypothetical protein